MSSQEAPARKETLSSLLRALNHSLRTPLSTLTNDISYFGSKLGEDEVGSSKRAISNITSQLNTLSELLLLDEKPEKITGFEFVKRAKSDLGLQGEISLCDLTSKLEIKLPMRHISHLLRQSACLVEGLFQTPRETKWIFSATTKEPIQTFELRGSGELGAMKKGSYISFLSLREHFPGKDELTPAVLDLALEQAKGDCKVVIAEADLSLTIRYPLEGIR